jgi:DNA-binding transcriptional LysR family regulator
MPNVSPLSSEKASVVWLQREKSAGRRRTALPLTGHLPGKAQLDQGGEAMNAGTSNLDRQLDLNALMLFYEVIQAGSFTAASAKLNLAKSSISRRISRLEEHFGSILIKKSARKLTLTEHGESLHRRCQKIAEELQAVSSEALVEHEEMQGTLRVSVPSDFGITWFANLVADFLKQCPQMVMVIRVYNSDIVDLNKEPFDIAIQVGELKKSSALVSKRLAMLSQAIYASPDYVAQHGTPQSIADCSCHDWIVTDVQQREGLWLFQANAERQAIRVAHRVQVDSARLARELAVMGLGVVLMPEIFGADAVHQQRLVRVMVPWQSPPLQVTAIFLSRDRIPKRARAFLEFFAERIRSWQAAITAGLCPHAHAMPAEDLPASGIISAS